MFSFLPRPTHRPTTIIIAIQNIAETSILANLITKIPKAHTDNKYFNPVYRFIVNAEAITEEINAANGEHYILFMSLDMLAQAEFKPMKAFLEIQKAHLPQNMPIVIAYDNNPGKYAKELAEYPFSGTASKDTSVGDVIEIFNKHPRMSSLKPSPPPPPVFNIYIAMEDIKNVSKLTHQLTHIQEVHPDNNYFQFNYIVIQNYDDIIKQLKAAGNNYYILFVSLDMVAREQFQTMRDIQKIHDAYPKGNRPVCIAYTNDRKKHAEIIGQYSFVETVSRYSTARSFIDLFNEHTRIKNLTMPISKIMISAPLPSPSDGCLAIPSPTKALPIKILIVDDMPTIRKTLHRMIKTLFEANKYHGFTIDEAENGQEAVDKAISHKESYSIIIMDINMPGAINGFQATAAIIAFQKANQKHPSAIFSCTDMRESDMFKQVGFLGYLSKQPIQQVNIVDLLNQAQKMGYIHGLRAPLLAVSSPSAASTNRSLADTPLHMASVTLPPTSSSFSSGGSPSAISAIRYLRSARKPTEDDTLDDPPSRGYGYHRRSSGGGSG